MPSRWGAVRFFESEEAFKAAPGSFVRVSPPERVMPMPEGLNIAAAVTPSS